MGGARHSTRSSCVGKQLADFLLASLYFAPKLVETIRIVGTSDVTHCSAPFERATRRSVSGFLR